MLQQHRGYLMIAVLVALAGIATITSAALSRTLMEQVASRFHVTQLQAFHLAEAGLDDALVSLAHEFSPLDANALTGMCLQSDPLNPSARIFAAPTTTTPPAAPAGTTPTCPELQTPEGSYSVTIRQNQGPGATMDRRVVVVATGHRGLTTTRLSALLELYGGYRTIFDYTVTVDRLNMDGNAVLGDQDDRVRLHIAGSEAGGAPLLTSNANVIWAKLVDFSDDGPTVQTLCPNCANPVVFPPSPPPAPIFALYTPPMRNPKFDVEPYYQLALAQQPTGSSGGGGKKGSGLGDAYHHITKDETIDGAQYPGGLDGVIYVEAGKTLTLKGNVTLRGTIVHEGMDNTGTGGIVLASNANLNIDSCAELHKDFDGTGGQDPAFACGMAIMGMPILNFNNTTTIDINGYVMGGNGPSTGTNDKSNIQSHGNIRGGVVGLFGVYELNVLGPGGSFYIEPVVHQMRLSGTGLYVTLRVPLTTPPGFPPMGRGAADQPKVLMWCGPGTTC